MGIKCIQIDTETHSALKLFCVKKRMTIIEITKKAIKEYIKKKRG